MLIASAGAAGFFTRLGLVKDHKPSKSLPAGFEYRVGCRNVPAKWFTVAITKINGTGRRLLFLPREGAKLAGPYREISHRLGLSKNTVLDIVKRDRVP